MADANHTTKRCIVCSEEKPTTDFSKQAARKDGLRRQCKACDAISRADYYQRNAEKRRAAAAEWKKKNPELAAQKLREWRKQNPEKIKAARKSWEEKNPGRVQQLNKEWHEKNRESALANMAVYRQEHPEYFAKKAKEWRAENQELARTITRRYKARRKGASGSFTDADIERLKVAQRGKCCYCRKPLLKYHIDHIVPVSKGGSNDPSNLQLLCPRCNISKGDKMPEVFAQKMGFLI